MGQFNSAKNLCGILFSCIALCHLSIPVLSQENSPYCDKQHFSKIFGREKSYRLYLPKGYETSDKKYPVIYFFHGWGGRHFKDDNALLNYTGIKELVDKYQTILVMWDGNMDTTEPRPYNIGNHADVKFSVQMKDYFPEMLAHIDQTYRTIANRQHRGIIGFSMGGFMSFYLAGKYAESIGAAVSLAGSPEFFVGSPENHTLYPIRYTFKNLANTSIRMHNGDTDILYHLNEEVMQGARWEAVPLDYRKFKGGHMIDHPGETNVFESAMVFILNSFLNPSKNPDRFSHVDLYPDFSSWNYLIHTNKNEPGFVYLRNVTKNGFGIYTRKWLPDGPPTKTDSFFIQTAPLYQRNETYDIIQFDKHTNRIRTSTQEADRNGRLSFFQTGDAEIGISSKSDSSSIIFLDYTTNKNCRYVQNKQNNSLSIRLLNRAITIYPTNQLTIHLSSTDQDISIYPATFGVSIKKGQRIIPLPPVTVTTNKKPPVHAEPPQLKFIVKIQNGKQYAEDDFVVPVLYDAPIFDSIRILDQNGNGMAEAGEPIQVYSGKNLLRLYTEDKWVIWEEEQVKAEMIPAKWPDGFTLSSIIRISPDCPPGHTIQFHSSYETKTFNPIERKTTWGRFSIKIQEKNSVKH